MSEQQISTISHSKKVHIETWGCQMNVADSEKMLSLMNQESYTLCDTPQDADLIILNTCHIREKAKHKVMSRLGVLRTFKEKNPKLTIAVTGCVAQAEGKKLLEESNLIDLLVGPGKISDLPRLLKEHAKQKKSQVSLGFDRHEEKDELKNKTSEGVLNCQKTDIIPLLSGRNHISRFVNIQQGCNNYCTFCVVPFTRGREISKQPQEILNEAKTLISQGAREITLLGQNVNSYGSDLLERNSLPEGYSEPFVNLLEEAVKIEGLESLRFTTSNPHDLTKSLANLFAKHEKLGKHFHLPVQSGSDRILSLMKRKVTREDYLEKVRWLKEACPDISISTDIIVGFPGETEEDFKQTLDLVKTVGFAFAFAFAYSKRKHTPAIRFKDQVDEDIQFKRLAELNLLLDSITMEQQESEVGKIRKALFMYPNKKEENCYYGRTEQYRLVRVKSPTRDLVGSSAYVLITRASKVALDGELVL